MIEANIKFEYDGYDIIAEGEVYSPGDIRKIKLDFIGLTRDEITQLDINIIKMAKELAKIELVNEVYESEIKL